MKTLVAGLLVAAAAAASAGQSTPRFDTAAVDGVFADYNRPGSPGCMLGVISDGAFQYTHGYGRASIEHDVPLTSETVFDIGSTSKQFLATAILLLAQDGKLSLDDDVRKYLPEVPDYGKTITIRHLLTHTSGLRDYITLMTLGGWQSEDVTSPAQALDLVSRQKALDFPPGTEFAYSNTGFFLGSLIVERVAGMNLARFAADRIFAPAGMNSTRYMDDHAAVVPRRAMGYEPAGQGFRVAMSNWEQLGDGAVQTSVADLLKWDRNFYSHAVGGDGLVAALQTPGRLANATAIEYGLGLFVGSYRGVTAVRHGGSWAGYRAELLRFPTEQTSIVVLCNLGTADPAERANRVADIVLHHRFAEPAPRPGDKRAAADTRELSRFAGTYWQPDRMLLLRFVTHDRGLALAAGDEPRPLEPVADGQYGVAERPVRFRFVAGTPNTIERHVDGAGSQTLLGREPWGPNSADLDRFTGSYTSEELQTRWQIVRDGEKLLIRDLRAPARTLVPAFRDVFTSGPLVVAFDSSAGRATGFSVGAGRAHGMRFTRVSEP